LSREDLAAGAGEKVRAKKDTGALVHTEQVESTILSIRGWRVILYADLARLYGVTTKRLNEQGKRSIERFPADFMFRLTKSEKAEVVANFDHLSGLKFPKSLRNAFTGMFLLRWDQGNGKNEKADQEESEGSYQ
jgi:hypothetical protein